MPKSEETLEAELADAKENYRSNTDDEKAKASYHKVRDALAEARYARRSAAGATGDTPSISDGNEG